MMAKQLLCKQWTIIDRIARIVCKEIYHGVSLKLSQLADFAGLIGFESFLGPCLVIFFVG